MYLYTLIERVNSFLSFAYNTIQGLIESFEYANKYSSVVCNELGSMSDDGLQRMDLGGFLWFLHIKTIKSWDEINRSMSPNNNNPTAMLSLENDS